MTEFSPSRHIPGRTFPLDTHSPGTIPCIIVTTSESAIEEVMDNWDEVEEFISRIRKSAYTAFGPAIKNNAG